MVKNIVFKAILCINIILKQNFKKYKLKCQLFSQLTPCILNPAASWGPCSQEGWGGLRAGGHSQAGCLHADPLTWGRPPSQPMPPVSSQGLCVSRPVPLAPGARHHSMKAEGASASEWDTVRTDGRSVGRSTRACRAWRWLPRRCSPRWRPPGCAGRKPVHLVWTFFLT